MFSPKLTVPAIAIAVGFGVPVLAQDVVEAPSTVDAAYVAESADVVLNPGEKIENLYTKNISQDNVLQKPANRVYFFQRQFYGTVFYVGDKGVLVFDALEGRTQALNQAVAQVTDLPITALLYSHQHADHIVDAKLLVEQNPDQPPFWGFAGSDSYLGYREMVELIGSLEWNHLSGGHGNVGSQDDVAYYLRYLDDIEAAAGEALGSVPWGAHSSFICSCERHLNCDSCR